MRQHVLIEIINSKIKNYNGSHELEFDIRDFEKLWKAIKSYEML